MLHLYYVTIAENAFPFVIGDQLNDQHLYSLPIMRRRGSQMSYLLAANNKPHRVTTRKVAPNEALSIPRDLQVPNSATNLIRLSHGVTRSSSDYCKAFAQRYYLLVFLETSDKPTAITTPL
jgi:hypothetical protein